MRLRREASNSSYITQEPNFKTLNAPVEVSRLNLLIQQIARLLNGNLSKGDGSHNSRTGNLDGEWIRVTTPATGDVEFAVSHSLNRIPIGYTVCGNEASPSRIGIVYTVNSGSWSDKVIYLACTGESNVLLLEVF